MFPAFRFRERLALPVAALCTLCAACVQSSHADTLATMSVQFTVATQCSVLSTPQLSAAIAPSISCEHDEPVDVALIEESAASSAPAVASAGQTSAIPEATPLKQQFWVVSF